MMELSKLNENHKLLAGLDGVELTGEPDVEVDAITHDSRLVMPGACFACIPGAVTDDPHMEFQGGSVRMDLDNSYLRSLVVRVLVESDETWFIGFDELHQSRDASPLSLELSRLQSVRRDEDEWSCQLRTLRLRI